MPEPTFENSRAGKAEIDPVLLAESRKNIESYFDKNNTGRKRIDAILDRIGPMLKSEFIDGEQIKASLEACVDVADKNEFVERVLEALKPILYFHAERPEDFQREAVEATNLPLNEILYYGVDQDIIHIHLKSVAELLKEHGKRDGITRVEELLEDGLRKLAIVIGKNEDIKKVTAKSWLCASKSGRRWLEELGFVWDGLISKEERELHFKDAVNAKGEPEKVAEMHMDRDEFLRKYGDK
ncbi:MAG: hypothetical protein A2312_03720 [Candidatus Staskawiczbacteria bacterium RIFOXYB2_FULL_32_9]|uniref:Uncharacterized protein n=1 Tax=Candidatus Staskawiczbacteria bacterium RIFOXYD1_FULL_32_13 TaxID=1802234 RepID=A0A1G2JQN7_9BACT|nr:MAG: hypothetical protein UR22_C0002G0032 [Parcubacteria group bacterium GW2011_GWC2_32_10]OGZ80204.1 MAG: hypothetical protein A2256_00195 [Candidatus Staskawiczbacteria bacterium RIFOXYA2_FULL_32_7]OGZ80756.1 MAG: hypothetical protein A2360_02525 [Candidatus Staskawiczbacteria bacterium RIFOXYB1_FULL_32_11]OGZ82292.1 MAG: hypothetical protein A2312_03720 [Candidatus Staskawiczbacteria bacterium RIFOXYB2_FULL_32_9]OGZ86875.1 MAG: hypothetical protein A2463_01855 [Candidatus Staskawiczbacter